MSVNRYDENAVVHNKASFQKHDKLHHKQAKGVAPGEQATMKLRH